MLPPQQKTLAEIYALTFEQVDRERGHTPTWNKLSDSDWFTEWYQSIYTTPFAELIDEDLVRICQQTWNKEYFVPVALRRLAIRPFSEGFTDDGDLLVAVGTQTPMEFWRRNPVYRQEFCRILNAALHQLRTNPEALAEEAIFVEDDTIAQLRDVQAILSCR